MNKNISKKFEMSSKKILCTRISEKLIDGKWVKEKDSPNFLCGEEISEDTYYMIVSDETIAFFRTLGAIETITYNSSGEVQQLISVSPNRNSRAIYTFDFLDHDAA